MLIRTSIRYYLGGIVLLVAFGFLLIGAARHDSQTIDEGTHLAAGYSYLRTGDWRLNPEHPPLAKLVAGLFVSAASPSLPLESDAWQEYKQWDFGRLFLYHNTKPAADLLFRGRLGILVFALGLAVATWLYAQRLFGRKVGLVSLFLIVLEPTILAHGHLVTTDIPLALTFFLAVMTFSSYLERPTRQRLIISIICFTLAQLTKYSAIVLVPTFIILYFIHRWWQAHPNTRPLRFWPLVGMFIVASGLLVWATYGFQVRTAATDPRIAELYHERDLIVANNSIDQQIPFVQFVVRTFDPATPFGGAVKNFLEQTPLPGYSYWRGLTTVFSHNASGHWAYLFGETSFSGWWYYFPVTFLVKTPLALLALLGLAIVLLVKRLWGPGLLTTIRRLNWQWYILGIPTAVYWFFSVTSHINLGIRHLAPTYPFIIFAAALATRWLWRRGRLGMVLSSIALISFAVSTLITYPYFLTYFNEAVGGPRQGHRILLDSNLDWGQELGSLGAYIKNNAITAPRIAYFGSAEVRYYIPDARPVPNDTEVVQTGIPADVIAISAGILFDPDLPYHWLRQHTPTIILGNALYVYDFRTVR